MTMILEIGVPHTFPTFILFLVSIQRWYDRRGRCDKSYSRKLLQNCYEELYVGPEFALEARLAQLVAIVWATFMFSHTLPILFPIACFNFFVINVMDRWFVLRFYRTPRNYNESMITKLINLLKLTFPFHFVMGLSMLSQGSILTGTSKEDLTSLNALNSWARSWFGFNIVTDQFQTFHILWFIFTNMTLMFCLLFQGRLFTFGKKYLSCCCKFFKKFEDRIDELEAVSNDYYKEIDLKYILSEYTRTGIEIQELQDLSISHDTKKKTASSKNVAKV